MREIIKIKSKKMNFKIYGSTSDGIDALGKKRLTNIREGHVLEILDCGAYVNEMQTHFGRIKKIEVITYEKEL